MYVDAAKIKISRLLRYFSLYGLRRKIIPKAIQRVCIACCSCCRECCKFTANPPQQIEVSGA